MEPPATPHTISVLMPTWQGAEFLDRVLAALARQKLAVPWDFLAIDSGSTDGTLAILERHRRSFPVPFAVRGIHKVEFDHGDTRNLLAALSSGELLVFLTQDAIPVGDDWLAKLALNFDRADVGAAYCRNVPRPDADPLTKIHSRGDPGYARERRETRLPPPAEYERLSPHEKRLLYNFNDVASAVRRSLWELHPFPRTWFGEDVLMARALLEAGHTVVYDAEACVEHSHDYGAEETFERAAIDGRFNAEWLGRICIASRSDAAVLAERLAGEDAAAIREAGFHGAEARALEARSRKLREAAFLGLHEGGKSALRRPATGLLERPDLRVLYVVHGFPPDTWAGTEIYTLNLASEMQRRGHAVTVLTRAPAAASEDAGGAPDFSISESEFHGLRVLRLVNRLAHRRLSESYREPRAEAAFREVLRRERPDVVHFQHLIHLSAGLVDVARELGLPTLLHCHDYWALCARVQLIRPDGVRCEENMGAGCYLCVKERALEHIGLAKKLGWVAGPLGEILAGALGQQEFADLRARHGELLESYAAADLRISPSRFLRQKLLDSGVFDPHAFLFSDNGMRTDHLRALEKLPDREGRVRFAFIGSLEWYKGGEVLVKAMARLAGERAVALFFGDFRPASHPHHAALEKLARASGAAVEFRGRFDNQHLSEVYREVDVLVVPSLWFENSPITIHEAYLARTPVVASDIGGMAEYVRPGIDGLTFRAGDDAALADALRRFLREPGLVRELARDFMPIKSIAEDAAATEFRYRGLAARRTTGGARGALGTRGALTLVDAPGWPAARSSGPVERQGDAYALLRPGGAAVEYDVPMGEPGGRSIEVEVLALGAEPGVELGGRVLLDGAEIGRIAPLRASAGADLVRRFEFECRSAGRSAALRLESALAAGGPEAHLRVQRVRVRELPEPGQAARAEGRRA